MNLESLKVQFNTKNYDYLIVGAGPYGSIFAY